MPSNKRRSIKRVRCLECSKKVPEKLTWASHLVYVKHSPYELSTDSVNIDNRVCGVCDECLKDKNAFQKQYKQVVDADNPDLIRGSF